MRLFFLFVLFIISVPGVAQTGNADEDYETASTYYERGDYKNAFRYFMSAAKAGDANAQNAIGNMYKNGESVIKSYTNAYQWYLKAANQGHYYAQYNLGDLYYEGNGVKQNYLKAFEWYSKAAEKGYAVAQNDIGHLYENGYGVKQDYMKAFEWYSKAADQGNIAAQNNLGDLYYEGNGVKQDYMKAYEWYLKAAEQGHADAQFNIGYLYYNGYGVKQDYMKAFEWYSKAADEGHAVAQNNIGNLYDNGYGVKQDYMKAFEWYSKAADKGDAGAQNNMGFLYYLGNGVKRDYIKAYEWFYKSAENGEPAAMYHLGEMFLNGEGINKDYIKAESWLKKTINSDPSVPFPYSSLAILYAQRDKDYTKALQYSDKAIALFDNRGSANQEADLYGERGLIFYLKGDMTNAEKMLTKCIDLNSEYLKGNDEFAKLMTNRTHNHNSILEDDIIHADKNIGANSDTDSNIVSNPVMNTNTFAIIIGNEKYKNEVDVPFANNDSKIFSQYVEKTLGVPHNQIRLIENAGYNDIRIAVNWLVQAMQVCRGKGKAIVYYAGHGIPNESDLSAYLLPVDGISNDPGSAYSLKELYEKLGSVEAQSITIFLDACFSGSKREDRMLASARGVALRAKQSAPKGYMIVFTAAQGDETAYPYKDKQHGMFTYFLLKKLQETKGDVTLGALSDYLTEEVSRQSFVKNNKMQTPTVNVSTLLKDSWRKMTLK